MPSFWDKLKGQVSNVVHNITSGASVDVHLAASGSDVRVNGPRPSLAQLAPYLIVAALLGYLFSRVRH